MNFQCSSSDFWKSFLKSRASSTGPVLLPNCWMVCRAWSNLGSHQVG